MSMDDIVYQLRGGLLENGLVIDRSEWQGVRDDRPQTKVLEIHDVRFQLPVDAGIESWQNNVKPNLPWAEDHFQERVSGEALNPGEQYKNWPWYEQGVEEHKPGGKFSHTYMERFWPKKAVALPHGIRFAIGDLEDLVLLLKDRPFTRQAYLPIWFPEDLWAARRGDRVPCTLGYHFQAIPRANETIDLNITYNMRSCDFYRYLRDDVYMAGRLLQWVSSKVGMLPRNLTVNIANLHIFSAETERLKQEHKTEELERVNRAFR